MPKMKFKIIEQIPNDLNTCSRVMSNCNLDLTSASQNTVPMVTDTLMDRIGSVPITIDTNISTAH